MNIWRDVRKNGQGSKNHEIPDFPAQQRSGMEVKMEKKLQPLEKKRLMIFAWVAFGVPMLMGIPMGILYNKGADVSLFPNAQMYYPAAGVMLAVLLTRRQGERVPVKFYTGFLLLTASLWAMCMLQVIFPAMNVLLSMNLVIIFGSLITWILLLLEKKETRRAAGLSWGKGKKTGTWLWVALFLALYLLRLFLNYALMGMPGAFLTIFTENPYLLINLVSLPLNFFMAYTAFFGEEYGWRAFLQPLLQKRYGKRAGVLLLGVVWGLWHLPINVFYYSPQTWVQSVLAQQLTCISLAIFFGLAWMKTQNVWAPVIMHFLNNNLIAVFAGSAEVISGQVIAWRDLLFLLIINGVCFASFILAKAYRKGETEEEKEAEGER